MSEQDHVEIALVKQRLDQHEDIMDRLEANHMELQNIVHKQHEMMAALKANLCHSPGRCDRLGDHVETSKGRVEKIDERLHKTERMLDVLTASTANLTEAVAALAKSQKYHGETLAGIKSQAVLLAGLVSLAASYIASIFTHK